MRLLFVMDPVEGIVLEKDTSFGFIEAALALGHECLHCLIHALERRSGGASSVTAPARRLAIVAGRLELVGAAERVEGARPSTRRTLMRRSSSRACAARRWW